MCRFNSVSGCRTISRLTHYISRLIPLLVDLPLPYGRLGFPLEQLLTFCLSTVTNSSRLPHFLQSTNNLPSRLTLPYSRLDSLLEQLSTFCLSTVTNPSRLPRSLQSTNNLPQSTCHFLQSTNILYQSTYPSCSRHVFVLQVMYSLFLTITPISRLTFPIVDQYSYTSRLIIALVDQLLF